jgi:hypothetical protein
MQWHDMTSIAFISNKGRGNGATVATMQRRTKRSVAGKEANHELQSMLFGLQGLDDTWCNIIARR